MGSVLSRGEVTAAAAEFQRQWIENAKALAEPAAAAANHGEGKSVRVDGTSMDKMDFDAVYSNAFTHKDTESAIGVGFVPVIDPRRDNITRPKGTRYGRKHEIMTAYGFREVLPTRSTLGIGEGHGRTWDF